jgi:ABC-type glycerol-3-phosphate transport system substrate-binding protein
MPGQRQVGGGKGSGGGMRSGGGVVKNIKNSPAAKDLKKVASNPKVKTAATVVGTVAVGKAARDKANRNEKVYRQNMKKKGK